ncbi:MAG: hypothetical protein ACM3NH_04360 [Candidatus Saccharibacteria bacterium]
MKENEMRPIMPPEGPQVTPEEQKRIVESGQEFEAEQQATRQSRERLKNKAETVDYADQGKILEGQQKRILRAKIAGLTGPKEALPSDFAVRRDLNDQSLVQMAKGKRFWEKLKNLFK